MYCKHCGKEITDDSTFCQYCGGKQDQFKEQTIEDSKSKEPKVVELPTIRAHFSDATKWWIIGCGFWIVINLYWLFAGDKRCFAGTEFLPFTDHIDEWCRVYDITEFIVYVFGMPLIIWGLVIINKKLNSDTTPQQNSSTPSISKSEEDINKALGI